MYSGVPTHRSRPRQAPSLSIRRASPKSVTCGTPDAVTPLDQDVARLQVAVQDAALVSVLYRPRHRRQQRRCGSQVLHEVRQGRFRPLPSISFIE